MKKITKIIMPIAASLVCVAPMACGIASCSCTTSEVTDAEMLAKINKVLSENETKHTMNDALVLLKSKDLDVVNIKAKATDGEYVWDQSINRFAIINSKTGALIQGPDGYTLNAKKWQLWKMVSETTFDSYCQYSQYLKAPATNALSKTTYSFIAGFDCGSNTTVKNVHYFYEKMDEQVAKDVIINTCSHSTNVDVSAWKNSDGSDGDVVSHYGNFGDLTIVTNKEYKEYGHGLYSDTYEGTVNVEDEAEITLVNVKTTGITVQKEGEKKTGKYTILTSDSEVAAEQTTKQGQTISVSTEEAIVAEKEAEYKKQETEIAYVLDATDGKGHTVHFNSLTEISNWSNTDHTASESEPSRTFEGWTITLNKDYDMILDSENWTSIGKYIDTTTYTNPFMGTFDGQNHSIINFNDSNHHKALFGVSKGDLKNINFVNCNRECTNGAANPLLVVKLADNANVDNVHCYNCSIKGTTNTSMIIFWVEPQNTGSTNKVTNCSTDKDCVVYNDTKGTQTAGIIAQAANVEYLYCENLINNAQITGCKSVGGIVGQLGDHTKYSEFKNCINTGKITMLKVASPVANTPYYTGGLVGYLNSGGIKSDAYVKFENCENNGDVTLDVTTEQAAKATAPVSTLCGGIYGYSTGFAVSCTKCKNTGNIGLVEGQEGDIDCKWAGGFSGYNNGDKSETFIRCENAGTIHANNGVGHLSVVIHTEQSATDCIISGGTLIDIDKRIKISGEPD